MMHPRWVGVTVKLSVSVGLSTYHDKSYHGMDLRLLDL
jgi:hypothetical protein